MRHTSDHEGPQPPAQGSNPAASPRRSPARAALQAALVAVVLGLLAWNTWRDWPEGWATRVDVRPLELVLGFASGAAGLVCLAGLFAATVRTTDAYRAEHVPYYHRVWLQSYFFRYLPARLLLLAHRVAMGRRVGISPAQSLLFVLLETALLLLAGALVLLALVPFSGRAASTPQLVVTFALVVVGVVLVPRTMRWAFRTGPVRRRLGAVHELPPWTTQIGLTLGYVCAWWLLSTAAFCAARVVSPLPWSELPLFTFWFVGAYVLGLVAAIAPAGLGVREAALAAGLSSVVPLPIATMLAFSGRLFLTMIELVVVAIAVATIHHPPPDDDGDER